MMQLNRDNYEMLMFDLLEGNIKEPHKSALLKEIQADVFYAVEWENWQKTILPADSSLVLDNKETLKKRGGKIIAFPFMHYAAAACLLLATGIAIYLYKGTADTTTLPIAEQSGKGKTPVKQVPALPTTDTSTVTLKEEIVRMAKEQKTEKAKPFVAPVPVTPRQQQLPQTPHETDQNNAPVVVARNEETPVKKQDPIVNDPTPKAPVIIAASNPVKVTIVDEIQPLETTKEKIKEKRRMLAGLFTKPKVTLEKAENKTGYRVVIKNEEYQLMAGY